MCFSEICELVTLGFPATLTAIQKKPPLMSTQLELLRNLTILLANLAALDPIRDELKCLTHFGDDDIIYNIAWSALNRMHEVLLRKCDEWLRLIQDNTGAVAIIADEFPLVHHGMSSEAAEKPILSLKQQLIDCGKLSNYDKECMRKDFALISFHESILLPIQKNHKNRELYEKYLEIHLKKQTQGMI